MFLNPVRLNPARLTVHLKIRLIKGRTRAACAEDRSPGDSPSPRSPRGGCITFRTGLLWLKAVFLRPATGPWEARRARRGNKP